MSCYNWISNAYTLRKVSNDDIEAFKISKVVSDTAEVLVCKTIDDNWLYYRNDGSAVPFVVASPDYARVTACAASDSPEDGLDSAILRFLLRTAFECRFCHEGIVSLHAACVELDGCAVAFTGRSGTGKSTRARAWVEGLGAQFISGDRPAIRLEANGSTACGVPWDGKEQIFRDVEVPLKCILEVRRSPLNYVRRLSQEQARQVIVQQSFIPMWDTEAAVMAMANIHALIRKTPVYRVFCGPSAQDAKAIHDILINHPERIRKEKNDMKIKKGFVLRNVVDEYIVMPTGDNIAKFEGAVVLNEVSAFIFKQLENSVSRDDLLAALLNEFEVDEATAAADLDALLRQFTDLGLLEA